MTFPSNIWKCRFRIAAILSFMLAAMAIFPNLAHAVTGEFQTIDGFTYCLDAETGEYLTDGIYEVDGEFYYFRGSGSAWGPAGSMGSGWVRGYEGHDYFFDRETGAMYRGGIFEVAGLYYYFRGSGNAWGPEGSMGRGWVRGYGEAAADYFFDRETGAMYGGGFFTVDGGLFYFGDDGAVRTGWVTDGGFIYYIDPYTGAPLADGIYEIDGASYYFRGAGSAWGPAGSMGSGWVRGYQGHDYFFDRETGAMLSGGIFEVAGEAYFFRPAGSAWGPEGSMGFGWVTDYGDPAADYYFDRETGRMYRGGLIAVGGRTYLFGDDGGVRTGWVTAGGNAYYVDPATGELLSGGIFEVDGESYYFRPAGSVWGPEGSMGSGWVRGYGDPAADYFFDRTTGRMLKGGIFEADDYKYLFSAEGVMQTGWAEIDGFTYCFGADGRMLADGIFEVDGESYYFRPAGSSWGPEGSRGTGWVHGYGDPAADYFFDRTTGRMYKGGFIAVGGRTYLFGDDGGVRTGWVTAGGNAYYVDPATGSLLKDGIYKIDGESYYFRGAGSSWGPEGSMGTGWVRGYQGQTYFFDRSTGRMLKDGIYKIDGESYYFRGAGSSWGPEGSMGTGWVTGYGSPAADYYFDRTTGRMYRNGIYTINNREWYFDAAGKLSTEPLPWSHTDAGWVNANGQVIPGAIAKGIDVSEWNGRIDWAKVKADGISFAILRIGYSTYLDSEFEYNVRECERLGIPYGVYVYSYARNAEQAGREADAVIKFLAGHTPSYPVYIDIEDPTAHAGLSPATFAAMATAFCTRIEKAGYEPGVYSMLSWWENYFTSSVFDNWSKWIAQIYSECEYAGSYRLWQCSWTGSVAGISGDVDLNFEFNDALQGPATTTGRVLDNGTYEIAAVSSPTLVLRVAGGSTADRANVCLSTDRDYPSQRFVFTWDASSNAYKITNVNSGLVLDLAGSQAVIGANIQQYHSVDWTDQRWVVSKTPNGYMIATAVNPSFYLRFDTTSPRDGANVQLGTSSSAETFTIRAV